LSFFFGVFDLDMYSANAFISTLSLPIYGNFEIPDDGTDMTF